MNVRGGTRKGRLPQLKPLASRGGNLETFEAEKSGRATTGIRGEREGEDTGAGASAGVPFPIGRRMSNRVLLIN